MARKQKPAVELASDLGWSAVCLHAHGDSEAEQALAFLWEVNPRAFDWLADRLSSVRSQIVAQGKARQG